MRQMRAAGIDSAFLGVGDMDGDYWLGAVPDLSNFYFSTYNSVFGDDPNPDVNAFVEKFAGMFGSRPGGSFALTGYSVIEAWAKAVTAAGTTDSGKVRDALEAFDNEPLLVGATSFNAEKHIQYNRPMVIMQVQGREDVRGRILRERDDREQLTLARPARITHQVAKRGRGDGCFRKANASPGAQAYLTVRRATRAAFNAAKTVRSRVPQP